MNLRGSARALEELLDETSRTAQMRQGNAMDGRNGTRCGTRDPGKKARGPAPGLQPSRDGLYGGCGPGKTGAPFRIPQTLKQEKTCPMEKNEIIKARLMPVALTLVAAILCTGFAANTAGAPPTTNP